MAALSKNAQYAAMILRRVGSFTQQAAERLIAAKMPGVRELGDTPPRSLWKELMAAGALQKAEDEGHFQIGPTARERRP
jgi:hypothetical protein